MVIPTYNAARSLQRTLDCLASFNTIIVSDGGSNDKTQDITKQAGATIIHQAKGRGPQLKAGAAATEDGWLLFFHADTTIEEDGIAAIHHFIKNTNNLKRAGYFRFKLNDDSAHSKKLERIIAWRCRTFAMPYGDQGLLIHKSFLDEMGGFKPIPIMEDVDLVWRIEKTHGKQALINLDADALTNADKFLADGYRWRSIKNVFCLFLFWIKVPPRLIVKIY